MRPGRRSGTFHVVRKDRPHVFVTGPLTANEARQWLAAYHRLPSAEARREVAFRTRRDRDPPEPSEYERNQQKGWQHVIYRVLDDGNGDVVAIFPNLRKSKTDPRVMLYHMSTGKEWHDRASLLRMARQWVMATPREERALYLHLTNEHGYRIRP